MRFNEFKLNEKLLEAISYMGIEEATPVQEKSIPDILEGKDMIVCAQTGTGKTAAFMLPILHRMTDIEHHHIRLLVIVPTRELAMQIDQQVQAFTYFLGLNSLAIYGGGDGSEWSIQKSALSQDVDIVIATPGKLISHLNMGYAKVDHIEYLVLDEADRMLDMGFYDDIQKIISFLPKRRQTLMFSATMPPRIRQLATKILNKPVEINISLSKPAEGVLQAAYLTFDNQKIPLITGLVKDKDSYKSILVFSSTKKKVMDIVRALKNNGYNVEGISSDLEQKEREEVLLRFRSRGTRILVATDVLSRGIDIKDIDLIINYDVPGDAEDYIHRVGRTARAEASGVALTLVSESDMHKFQRIEKLIEREVMKIPLPSELGDGPQWKLYKFQRKTNFRNKHKRKGDNSKNKNYRKPGKPNTAS